MITPMDTRAIPFCIALTRRILGFNDPAIAGALYVAALGMPYNGSDPWDADGTIGIGTEALLETALRDTVRLVKACVDLCPGGKPDRGAIASLLPLAFGRPVRARPAADIGDAANGGDGAWVASGSFGGAPMTCERMTPGIEAALAAGPNPLIAADRDYWLAFGVESGRAARRMGKVRPPVSAGPFTEACLRGWDEEDARLAVAEDAAHTPACDARSAAEGADGTDCVCEDPPAHDNLVATMGLSAERVAFDGSDGDHAALDAELKALAKGAGTGHLRDGLIVDDPWPLAEATAEERAAAQARVHPDDMKPALAPGGTLVAVHHVDDAPKRPRCGKVYGQSESMPPIDKVCGREPGHAGAHGKGRAGGGS